MKKTYITNRFGVRSRTVLCALCLAVAAPAVVSAREDAGGGAQRASEQKPPAVRSVIKGRIVDEEHKPLLGATVFETGTSNAVVADREGGYSISVVPREGLTLTFSFLGMESQVVEVKNRTTIDVVLKSDAVHIGDVVVTGYGNILREAYTGSAAVISKSDLAGRGGGSLENMLGGMVPGLVTSSSGQPGDAAEMRLRGFGSIDGSGAPIYVIDGVIFDNANLSGNSSLTSSPLATLNPADIESVTILKDAASASLYGSQGANGVIVITTRQGETSDRVRYSFSAQAGFSKIFGAVRPELVNSQQFMELWTEGNFHSLIQSQNSSRFVENLRGLYEDKLNYRVDGRNYYEWYKLAKQNFNDFYAIPRPDGTHARYDYWGADADKLPNVNWYDKILRNALFMDYNLSMSGGSSSLKYYASIGYLNQQGIIINSDLQRYSARVKLNSDDRKKLVNWGASLNISRTEQTGPLTSGTNYNIPHYSALLLPSVVPAYLEDGSYNFNFPNNLLNGTHNPIASAKENIRKRPVLNLFASAYLRLNITDWLNFRSDVSQYYITGGRFDYFDSDFGSGYATNGQLVSYNSKHVKLTNKNMLNFDYTLDNAHRFSATVGLEIVDLDHEYDSVTGINFVNDEKPVLSSASEISNWTGNGWGYSMVAIISRLDYSYRNKYFVGGSFREDRSSRFSPDYRTGDFWSVSLGYRITNEDWGWIKGLKKVVNDLKFKASYGYNGSLPSSYYGWRTLYSGTGSYNSEGALSQSVRATWDLTWEKNRVFNAGVDMGLLRNRIRLSAEYYTRESSDLLQEVPVSEVSGYSTMLMNTSAGVRNRGFELDLDARILERSFKWGLKLNLATLHSEYFGLQQDIINSSYNQIMRNGESVNAWYMYKFAGVDPNTGEATYYGTDSEGRDIINRGSGASRRVVGKGIPSVTGGFSTLFSWRGWNLSAQFTYGWGHQVLDSRYSSRLGTDGRTINNNIDIRQLDRWTPENIYASNIIRINGRTSNYTSTRYLYDGDYLKMKNIRLQYLFPASTFRKLNLTGVTVYAQVENLWVWSKAPGYDPDMQINGYISTAKYPSATTFTAGLNFNF